jgi:hypothetical protein
MIRSFSERAGKLRQSGEMTSAKTIRMGFLETDDRLLVDFVNAEHTQTMLITRRIARRIIRGVAQLLAQSSAVMARVPVSHKTDVLVWEHLSALQTGNAATIPGEKSADNQPTDRPAKPFPLLHKLDINVQPSSFHLAFVGVDNQSFSIDVTRSELHRLIAALRQAARHAEWDLDAEVGWLVEADAPAIVPGSLAS